MCNLFFICCFFLGILAVFGREHSNMGLNVNRILLFTIVLLEPKELHLATKDTESVKLTY